MTASITKTQKQLGKFILIIIILLLPLIGFVFLIIPTYTQDEPIHVHLTWQNNPNTTITMLWKTSFANAGDLVLYDNVSRGGVPGSYKYNTTGIKFTYTGAGGYIHQVELTDLIPDTIYYFVCGGPTGGYSSERSFRTAPFDLIDIRFVAGGDSRSQPTEREKVSQVMAKFNPAFVMQVGDMVNDGTIQSQWDTWFSDLYSNWIGTNNQTITIISAIGNHESNSINYYSQFALPGNEQWFSYNWGSDLHIIVLSTETSTSGTQKTWLESDLANHSDFKWKIVIFHQPPFPATRPSGHAGVLADWVPLFDKYHVDIVFAGHDHAYLRTVPINYTESQSQAQPYENGTVYIITGGWGAPLHTLNPHWYDAYGMEAYHFCLVDVFQNGSLHIQAKDNQGNTFDEAWIIKNQFLPLSVSINLTSPVFHDSLPIDLTWNASGIIDHYKVYIDGQFQQYLASMQKSYQITSLTEGNHTIDVSAVDPLGNVINATMELNYNITDSIPPVADLAPVQNTPVGSIVTFNASGSTDNVGIVSYEWNFGDGNITTTTTPLITHIYSQPGIYIVNLTVKDGANNNDNTTITVTVEGTEGGFPWWIVGVFVVAVVLVISDIIIKRKIVKSQTKKGNTLQKRFLNI